MKDARRQQREWLEHRYYRTYQIADFAEAVATEPFAHIHDLLESFAAEDRLVPLVLPWQRRSALHHFAAFIADALFDSDLSELQLIPIESDRWPPRRILPVDRALHVYGISDAPFCLDASLTRQPPGSPAVADAYFDYFSDLRWTAAYAELLERIADEVFYVMFQNRAALASLHTLLAMYVSEMDPDGFDEDEEAEAASFAEPGRLKRKPPPQWAQRAVFFREHGRCATCGRDLTGLLDALSARHFDHIVPLAAGGLNDVSNLQLLCQRCNGRKAAGRVAPSDRYRRWYPC